MVNRTFIAFDNNAFTVDPSSPSGAAGSGIVNNSDTPVGQIFQFTDGFPPQTITVDDQGGDPDIFEDDDPANHSIVDGSGLVADGTAVESESIHTVRQIDANGDPFGPEIQITVFSQGGDFTNIWGMATDTPLVDGARYVKTDGTNDGDSLYTELVPCFASGTLIRTPTGLVPVEDLLAGQLVWTHANPNAVVRWVGAAEVDGTGALAPVAFEPDSIGNTRRLVVSPQHRILMDDLRAEMLFGTRSVFVAAKHLVGMAGVSRAPCRRITYRHFMFDRHAVVESDGALTESFFPGAAALSSLDRLVRDEIYTLFPELADAPECYGRMAHPCLAEFEVMAMRRMP